MKQLSKISMNVLLLALVVIGTQFLSATAHASQATIDADFANRELAVAQTKVAAAANLVERVLAEQNYLDLQAKYEKVIARAARLKSSEQSRMHRATPELQAKIDPNMGSDS